MKHIFSFFIFMHSLISLPKVAFFLGVMISIWGLLSYNAIPKENAPYIAFGIVNISTPYAGVAAADINDLITEKIESKIKTISGLNSYSSVSTNGLSNISLEFDPDVNMVKAISDVRSRVSESIPLLPTDLDTDPIITEIDSSLTPFFTITLSGDASALQLYDHAKNLEKALERVDGVSKIAISGGAERQIIIKLNRDKMQAMGISIDEVINTLRNANKDIPVGNIDIADKSYIVRFEGKFKTTEDIGNVVLKNIQKNTAETASVITIKDIAEVQEEGKSDPIITRFSTADKKTQNAIFVSVSRSTSRDIFSIDAKTREAVEAFAKTQLPQNISVSYTNEVLPNIEQSFREVFTVGYEAIFIVMIIIFLFVGVMDGIISALIIPITVLFTIGILNLMGASLNFMTNFSMILALGILVDNAIVIVQGTYMNMKKGMDSIEAAKKTVDDFKAPLISGTLTTLAVFLPLLSLPGVLGQYLSFIPITVSIALFSSLIIALFLISSYTAGIMPWANKTFGGYTIQWLENLRNSVDYFIDEIYGTFLYRILPSRTIRLSVLLGSVILFVLSLYIPLQSSQFPAGDSDMISVQVEKPVGTLQEIVLQDIVELERFIASFPETKQFATTLQNEKATIDIELYSKADREEKAMKTSMDLEKEINNFLLSLHNAKSQVISQQKGPPSDSPVAFRILVNDSSALENAKKTTQELTAIMKTIDGTSGVKNNIKEIPGEFRLSINREKAIRLGINPDSIAMSIRSMVNGANATTVTRGGNDIDVIVQYDTKGIKTLEDIKRISLLSASGSAIPLSEVVEQKQFNGVESIFREDGDMAFTISAFLGTKKNGDKGNAAEITEAFKKQIALYTLPENVSIVDAGESASNEDLNNSLALGGITAILLMYFIVFLQFRSFLQPVIILQTIIFAQIGVNIGLFLFDIPKSLAYTLGLITLFGIIVNHTIILIDQINKNRQAYGKDISYAEIVSVVTEGCKSRFHPVMMTGIATIAGLVPLLSVDEFWYGLASTIIFGLLTATVFVFVVTPATYIQFEKEKTRTFISLFAVIIGIIALSALIKAIIY